MTGSRPCSKARGHRRTWTTRDVAALLRLSSFPAVSVLVSTTPSPTVSVTDETWLEDLLDEAALRLRRDRVVNSALLIAGLHHLARSTLAVPPGHGYGLFVAAGVRRSCVLAAPPVDRVVIDRSFSIGDLFSPSSGLPTAQWSCWTAEAVCPPAPPASLSTLRLHDRTHRRRCAEAQIDTDGECTPVVYEPAPPPASSEVGGCSS